MKPVDVRSELVEALRLDLVGPENGSDLEAEILSQAPSRWYLTGFLVPLEASESQRGDGQKGPPTRWQKRGRPPTRSWAGAGQSQSRRLTETLIFDPDPQRSTLASHP